MSSGTIYDKSMLNDIVVELKECSYYTTIFRVSNKKAFSSGISSDILVTLHQHTVEQIADKIRETIQLVNPKISDQTLNEVTVKASPEVISKLSVKHITSPERTALLMFDNIGIHITDKE